MQSKRSLIVSLISIVYCLFTANINVSGQNNNDIKVSFVKTNDSLKTSELYFNVIKICNYSSKPITGIISFNPPENWKLINSNSEKASIPSGDSLLIPVRLSPANDAIGGISYILEATLKTAQRQISSKSYITLPLISKWEFNVEKKNIYFSENNMNSDFHVKLSNKGNTNELIKLHFHAGKLLYFNDDVSNEKDEFIKLPANKDTVITYSVSYQTKLSYDDKFRFENNWKESIVKITASTESSIRDYTLETKKFSNKYSNVRDQSQSPLNLLYMLSNIMSSENPANYLSVYGQVLLPKNAEFQYRASLQNYMIGNNNIDFTNQLMYDITYSDNKNKIQLGYNVTGGELNAINGRGITGLFNINSRNSISYSLIQNPYTNSLGEVVGYSATLKGLSLRTELSHNNNSDNSYSATSGLLGIGFRLFKHHSFKFDLLYSLSKFKLPPGNDTTLLGYSYKWAYRVDYKNFNLDFNALNSKNNYIYNSGREQYYVVGRYKLSNNANILLSGSRYYYGTAIYPYNFSHPVGFNSTDYVRMVLALSSGSTLFQIGPNYNGTIRRTYNSANGNVSDYQTYQPGIYGAVSIKINSKGTLTPNITVNNMRFFYNSNDPTNTFFSSTDNIYYSVGLNYSDRALRVNAYYTSGSATDLYRSILVSANPTVSKSLQFRPSYEYYLLKRSIKLTASINYAYYIPSQSENIAYSFRYEQFLKGGWELSLNGFMYSNSRIDQQSVRINTKDLNFSIGVCKSFNIQQPRLKYYNMRSVFFNDLDGNGIKTDKEPPVANVLVNIQKDRTLSKTPANIQEVQLLSDVNGEIEFENLPKDYYKMTFTPLENLHSLYFMKGNQQTYFNDKDKTWYVPLVESYKIKGKIILIRDQNSTEGKIDLEGIRIVASGSKGETFSALTDNFGSYIVNVPGADKYKVHITNPFGKNFTIDNDESEIQFSQNKTLNLDFVFVENVRGIQFENGNELFQFSSLGGKSEGSNVEPIVDKNENIPESNSEISYSVQIGASKKYQDPSYFIRKFNLKEDVQFIEKNGEYKYYIGNFKTKNAANSQKIKLGIKGAFVASVDPTLFQSGFAAAPKTVPNVNSQAPKLLKTENSNNKSVSTKSMASSNMTVPSSAKSDIIQQNSTSAGVKQEVTNEKYVPKNDSSTAKFISAGTGIISPTQASEIPSVKAENTSKTAGKLPTVYTENPSKTIENQPSKVIVNPSNSIVEPQVKTTEQPKITVEKSGPVSKTPVQVVDSNPVKNKANQQVAVNKTNVEKSVPKVEKSEFPGENIPTKTSNATTVNETVSPKSQDSYMYVIQLDIQKTYNDPAVYKAKYNLKDEVYYLESNGKYLYYTGNFATIEEAKAAITRYGLMGFIMKMEDRSALKRRK